MVASFPLGQLKIPINQRYKFLELFTHLGVNQECLISGINATN